MPASLSLSLSICNYISLGFDCFANLELFAALEMLSNCPCVCWCMCDCMCVLVCLFVFPPHVLNWFDLIDSLRFSMLVHPKLLAIWHFDSFVSSENKSEKFNCECVCVCMCTVVCLWFVFRCFCICEKFLKLLQVNIFLCPSQLFVECSLNWQLLCGIAFFPSMSLFFYFAHTLTE